MKSQKNKIRVALHNVFDNDDSHGWMYKRSDLFTFNLTRTHARLFTVYSKDRVKPKIKDPPPKREKNMISIL